jgi:hypothetical protein
MALLIYMEQCDIQSARIQKVLMIIDEVRFIGNEVWARAKVAYPKKKAFHKQYGRERLRRREKKLAQFQVMTLPVLGAVRIAAILSQPIPNYPKGAL